MSSFLNTSTPDIVKNRFTKNGLSSASQQSHIQSTAATQKWNNQSFTSTPQSGRQFQANASFDNNNSYQNLSSASIVAGSANKTLINSQSQRYFADSNSRDRNDYQRGLGFEVNQFSPFSGNNNQSNQSINQYYGNQMQGPADDQQRVYNTVLKNNNYQLSSASTANFGRQQDSNSLYGQSIASQINNQYLASKSVSYPVNNILNKGMNNATQINKNRQDENDLHYLQQIKHQELCKNQRMISTMREQGFLQNQQNDLLFKDGQTFINSRKILLDILIAVIVIIIAYVIYRLNCLVLNSRFSLTSELKYVGALSLSIISKIGVFKHKIQVNSSFLAQTVLGFCVDSLAIQYCINEIITVFLVQKLNMDIRYNYKEYYLMALSLTCTLFYYINGRFIENNQIQNVNRQIRTIVKQTFTDLMYNTLTLLKISLLPILFAYIGMFLNGERVSQLFLHRFDTYNSPTKSMILIILFKICSELVINLKSQYIWNFLSELHDVHQIQHYYFIVADQKLSDDFLELKALKFWQANFNNRQRVNILKTISIEGSSTQIWNVFLRNGVLLKERLNNFKMNNISLFENTQKISQKCPKKLHQKIVFYFKNYRLFLAHLAAYQDLVYLLDMVTYSIQNLTNCMVAYSHIREYSELFNSVYSIQTVSEYMHSVFQDLIEIQGVIERDQKLSQIYRQLLSNMSTLISISQDQKLFNATIRQILQNPDSFYS